jgi:phosphopantothenate synthetase
MQARALIENASFGPDAQARGQAFDVAWAEIAGNFGEEPARVAAARLKLATAMLSVADNDSRDVEVLKRAALQALAKDYRLRSPRIATLLTGQH